MENISIIILMSTPFGLIEGHQDQEAYYFIDLWNKL